MGTPAKEATAAGEPAVFSFRATAAGVLTVVVSASGDVRIRITDADGQEVPNGSADGDLGGNTGAELLAVPLSEAGNYLVEVVLLADEGGADFTINASFLVEQVFARPADPDKRPSQAKVVTAGSASNDSIDPDGGDLWDWYKLTVAETGTLVFVTRVAEGVEGDLKIQAYVGEDYSEPTEESDQDLQGTLGNESVTLAVTKGQVIYVKVASLGTSGPKTEYRFSVGNIP